MVFCDVIALISTRVVNSASAVGMEGELLGGFAVMGLVVIVSLVSPAVVGDVVFEGGGGDDDELPGVCIMVLLGAPETGIGIVVSATVTEGVDFKLVFVALLAWEGSVESPNTSTCLQL